MRLILPVPPSPNSWKKNPWAMHVQKNEYRKQVWMAAIKQHKPFRDPPAMVSAAVTFYYAKHARDDDNLSASTKWVWDALRQKQTGAMKWREGLYTLCGYLVDDDPSHLSIAAVEQIKVPKVKEERLVLTLEAA